MNKYIIPFIRGKHNRSLGRFVSFSGFATKSSFSIPKQSSDTNTLNTPSLLSLLPSVQRALSSSNDLSSSLKDISESFALPSSSSPTFSSDFFLPQVILPKLAAACTQGRGQGAVGQEFLRTALSPLCAVITRMDDFSPLAAVAEAYTHVGDRVVLAKSGHEEDRVKSVNGGHGTSSRLSEASKLLLLRKVADQTLGLLSSSTKSAPLDTNDKTASNKQLTVQQSDKLVRILASLSRTSLFLPDLYERSLPHVTSLFKRMPRGPQALHTLSRTAGAFIRYNPTLEHLSSPLASRLVLELDYSRAELSKSLKHAGLECGKGKGREGERNRGGNSLDADEVRRRLQPAIGSLWYLALATRFGTDLKNEANKESNVNVLNTSPRGHSSSSFNTMAIEEIALQKGFDFINFAYESWEQQQAQETSQENLYSSSTSSSPSSHRTIRLNASDIGRLSALQLGAYAISSPLQFSEALLLAIEGWRRLKKDTSYIKTSKLQIDVRSAIVSLCGTTKLPPPKAEYATEEGLIVDFAWTHSDHDTNSEKEPRGVALEVDGPAHFVLIENEQEKEQTVSDDSKSDGVGQEKTNLSSSTTHKQPVSSSSQKSLMHALDAPSRYKFWLLERFGWQVIHVPWSEWPRKESLLEKSRYIANRLSESSELKQALR